MSRGDKVFYGSMAVLLGVMLGLLIVALVMTVQSLPAVTP